eukprot:CFRG8482T1
MSSTRMLRIFSRPLPQRIEVNSPSSKFNPVHQMATTGEGNTAPLRTSANTGNGDTRGRIQKLEDRLRN